MIWNKERENLKFNCHCKTPVQRLHKRIDVEAMISGNYAYICPRCKTVYDVWTKSNQTRFFSIFIGILIIILILRFL